MKYKVAKYFILSVLFVSTLGVSVSHAQTSSSIDLLNNVLDQLNNATSTSAATSVATGFSRDGIYGCTGAAYGAVGMQGPGGSHVPVFDGAVHDQERLLTYKECLLDGILNSMRETLISDIIRRVVSWANTGFDGNPAYITNLPLHMLENISDPVAERVITGAQTETLAEPFRRDVRVALARNYSRETRSPQNSLACDLTTSQLNSFSSGDFNSGGGWESFYKLTTNPSCNPLFAYYSAENQLTESIADEQTREQTQLDWGSGFRTVETDKTIDLGGGDTTNLKRVVTPGFMIADHLRQTIGTGLRQSENADEIDEIVSALMSHIGVELLSDVEGFSGLSKSFSGEAPYVDRLAQDSAARTRSNMTGAGASIVNNTIRIEQEYAQARQAAANTLSNTRRQLESWENTCWIEITKQATIDLKEEVTGQVCGLNTTNTCTTPVQTTQTLAVDAVDISTPSASTIIVKGRASTGSSIIQVTATDGTNNVGPVQPTVTTDGNWATNAIDLATLPDGTITVTTIETLASGSGTFAPILSLVKKTTTPTGVVLTVPIEKPAVTITATARSTTKSATLNVSAQESRRIIDQSIQPVLDLINENVARSLKALEVLAKIRNDLEKTSSASGQRFILEKLDELIASRVLHTEAQLRQATTQADEIETAMQQLLEETRTNWEEGWCKPDNWTQHKI
ncbi:hypothetical protein JXR01_02695 [Candidatus Kaiserbacteria bacterium]|nr:MAG: hypothetical protein JXR01_02695 [Candidatus Kaiserbacteria bacterium]